MTRPTSGDGRPTGLQYVHPGSVIHPASCSVSHPASCSVSHPASCSVIHPASSSVIHPASCSVIHPASCSVIHPASRSVIHPASCSVIHPASCSTCAEGCFTGGGLKRPQREAEIPLHLVPTLSMGSVVSPLSYAIMIWGVIKQRHKFTFLYAR